MVELMGGKDKVVSDLTDFALSVTHADLRRELGVSVAV